MTLQEAFRGLDDYNFILLGETLHEEKLMLAAIGTKLYRGGFECRFFDLNALAVEASPRASEIMSDGGYTDQIAISAGGLLELNRDIDFRGNVDGENGFRVRITLAKQAPGRWSRAILVKYPGDDGYIDKKLLLREWDSAVWETING